MPGHAKMYCLQLHDECSYIQKRLQITVLGSSPYDIKCFEVTVAVIWCYSMWIKWNLIEKAKLLDDSWLFILHHSVGTKFKCYWPKIFERGFDCLQERKKKAVWRHKSQRRELTSFTQKEQMLNRKLLLPHNDITLCLFWWQFLDIYLYLYAYYMYICKQVRRAKVKLEAKW